MSGSLSGNKLNKKRERDSEIERKKEREIEWSGILEIPRLKNDTKREREREREIMKKKT